MTNNKQKNEQANETTANKPYGHAAVPVQAPRGQTKWYRVGPVWKKKDGEGFILEIEVLPVGNYDGPLRVVITPSKNED